MKLPKDRKGYPFLTYPGTPFAHGIFIQYIVSISGDRQISGHHSDVTWPGVLQYFLCIIPGWCYKTLMKQDGFAPKRWKFGSPIFYTCSVAGSKISNESAVGIFRVYARPL